MSMNWLHTWAGVVLGGLLFAIFWTGTLSVFDREIDRWMMPEMRLALPPTPLTLDVLHPSIAEAGRARSSFVAIILPSERQPVFRLAWRDRSGLVVRYLDPATGAVLPDSGTRAASGFIYPFHYMLHIRGWDVGIWVVGLASMAMLLLCVSGVVVHRKIFTDFFAFRAGRQPRRAILDLHNVAGVLALPFHVAITLSGLIFFYSIYFQSSWRMFYPDRRAFVTEEVGDFSRPRQNKPGELGSLDAIVSEARSRWGGELPRAVVVRLPGDASAYIQVSHPYDDKVSLSGDLIYFDGATGALLHQRTEMQPMAMIQRFIVGLHLVRFRHWSLRWLYFGLGLAGCVTIATGYLFWLESRRRKVMPYGLPGFRFVEGMTVGSVTGIVIATLVFFIANRLLPSGMPWLEQERSTLEIWAFFFAWLASFGHAWSRPAQAWREQSWAIGVLATAAVGSNWITTGDHLGRSLVHFHLWPVGGMDLLLLLGAAVTFMTASRLSMDRQGAGQ
jgi:uncharacterized iron-regulated membrane protein